MNIYTKSDYTADCTTVGRVLAISKLFRFVAKTIIIALKSTIPVVITTQGQVTNQLTKN